MKLSLLYEQIIRENFKSQKQRFIKQGIDVEIVKSYFDKFKHIKDKGYKELKAEIGGVSVVPDRRNDIDAYKDFHELERVVDYVSGQRDVSTSMKGTELEVSGEAIYKDENFEVYYADSPRACIKYKGKIPYSWCVARSDASNMFYTYRFKPYEPAFYFIKDVKASEKEFKAWNMAKNIFKGKFSNPYHFFVIQVPKNIKVDDDEQKQYIVTSANNDGDTQMGWNDIVKLNPKVKRIREVLTPKPFTPDERKQHERFKSGISDNEFHRLTYEDKRNYLDIYPTIGKGITDRQLMDLPDDLMNLYASFGIGFTNEQHKFVEGNKSKVMKRYIDITKRKYDEYMEKDGYQRKQLILNFSEAKTLQDEQLKQFMDTLGRIDLNEFLHDGGWEAIEYLKEHLSSKLDDNEKNIINLLHNLDDENSLNTLNGMLPDGVFIKTHGSDDILLNVDSIVADNFWGTFDAGDDVEWLYGGYNSGRYDYGGYFDGYDDSLTDEFKDKIQSMIDGDHEIISDIKSVGIEPTFEKIKDLLGSYGKFEYVLDIIDSEWTQAAGYAEEKAASIYMGKLNNLINIEGYDNEIYLSHKALIIYIRHHDLFTNNDDDFISNVTTLVEELPSEFNLPNNYYELEEQARDDEHQYMEVDESEIERQIVNSIEGALGEYLDDNSDDDEDYGDETKLHKLKSEVIGFLNNTLSKLGQKPDSAHIENELVVIDIDRSKFKLDGSVYVDIFDKEHKNHHQGYIKITDLPTYFQNYKLLETMKRFNQLIK